MDISDWKGSEWSRMYYYIDNPWKEVRDNILAQMNIQWENLY